MLNTRIFAKDPNGEVIEDFAGMVHRVSSTLAGSQLEYDDFSEVLTNLYFLPNSPCLVNAGRPLGQLAACFVLPVHDSIDGIMNAAHWAAKIHQTGGGTGFDYSLLREAGARVSTTGNVATGPVGFMEIIDVTTKWIAQGGVRRGANMGILRVDHPNILEFIRAKLPNEGGHRALTNFNISVAITDEFLAALREGGDYKLRSPLGYEVGSLHAQDVWDLIAECAWATGDPGLFFVDEVNRLDPVPGLGRIAATNPCGEVPLRPFETCNLGSIDLARMVASNGEWNMARFEQVVRVGTRFLNQVIDHNKYPLPEVEEMTRKTRKIGLGVMGWADALIKRGIRYDSEEALIEASKVARFMRLTAFDESAKLAIRDGNFPAWDLSIYAKDNQPMRNSTRTVQAPTGTIAKIAGASGGIEPLFRVNYKANVMDTVLEFRHPLWDTTPEALRAKLFRTADQIDPYWHVRMQAAFQDETDDSISKTINMPFSATVADVKAAYDLAIQLGVKGLTIFRDGCLTTGQVLESIADQTEGLCPECKSDLIHTEGCEECPNCGYLACSS